MSLALLLDLDGTLFDTLDLIVQAMNRTLEEVRVRPLAPEELRPLIGMPVEQQMKILRKVEGPLVEEITDRYYTYFHEAVDRGLRCFPGVPETLERLGSRPIATMTTRRREEARHMLEVAGIASFFRAIVGGDEVLRPKPFPDLPLHAAKALQVPPSYCVIVGDAPVDILAGRAARMWTVAVMYGYGTPQALAEAKPHATVERFPEVPQVVEELEALHGDP